MAQKLLQSAYYISRALEIAQRRYEVLAKRYGDSAPLFEGSPDTFGQEAENFKAVSDALFDNRLKLSSAVVVVGKPDTPAQRVDPIPRPPKLNPEDFEL